jgi:regulator of nonsense transcripts 1
VFALQDKNHAARIEPGTYSPLLNIYIFLGAEKFCAQVMQVELTRNGKASTTDAKLRRLQGKMAQLSFSGASQAEKLSIRTIGREDPTSAEAFRTHIIFQVIYKETAFLTFPFVLDIWFPKRAKPMDSSVPVNSIPIAFDSRPLNESQRSAVKAILSDNPSDRLVLIQGPPGTGKTTVIAAAVISAISFRSSEQGLWLVAQSNVAVKNIAEKLADVEFFDFKLLVSKDFHFDWYRYSPLTTHSL